MKRSKQILLFSMPLVALVFIIWYSFKLGKHMEESMMKLIPSSKSTLTLTTPTGAASEMVQAIHHPLAIFILQIILIIVASQLCAFLFRKINQPSVLGEIVAGILLGPSFVGALFPQFTSFVFPLSSLGNLQMLSQVGLILFMFVIGIELDMNFFKKKASAAFLISHFSIVFPFAMGVGLSLLLYSKYAPAGVHFYSFSLFIGIALSITAFPVLARIIRERGIMNTRLGSLSIAAAAAGDVVAWCMLAFIVAISKAGSFHAAINTLVALVVYVVIMLLFVKPLLIRITAISFHHSVLKRSSLAILFVVLLFSSWCCEVIGIHALFGAFFAGVILPRNDSFRQALVNKIEDISMVLLLPMFFVFTGLRTQIGLLNDVNLWLMALLIIVIAVVGKFGGSAIAARISGENLNDSLAIGALMNTRGLVELVVLNIGYDLGILSPQLFTMMVFMALVTTFMTNPALNLINKWVRQ